MKLRLLPLVLVAAACGSPTGQPAERITIPPGGGFATVRDTLVERGLVRHPRWFTIVARVRGLDRALKAGVYDISPDMSASGILDMLAQGREAMDEVTIPEGLTAAEVAGQLHRVLGVDTADVMAASTDPALVSLVSPTAPSLEGYLYPETYRVPASITGRRMVEIMAREFLRRWQPEWTERLDSLGMSREEIIALASIVEGEARVADERPVIAGVYHNRLQAGMRLQADPTVQYAIQQVTGKRKPRLFLRDYQFPSDYNTYLIEGLPPGPVSSPGNASIQAALYPAEVPYLYFVADSTGRHVFSRSYQEHIATIARLRGTAP